MIQRGEEKKLWTGLPICPPGPPGERLAECLSLPFFHLIAALYCGMQTGLLKAQALSSFNKSFAHFHPSLSEISHSGFQHFVTTPAVNKSSYESATYRVTPLQSFASKTEYTERVHGMPWRYKGPHFSRPKVVHMAGQQESWHCSWMWEQGRKDTQFGNPRIWGK